MAAMLRPATMGDSAALAMRKLLLATRYSGNTSRLKPPITPPMNAYPMAANQGDGFLRKGSATECKPISSRTSPRIRSTNSPKKPNKISKMISTISYFFNSCISSLHEG
jgi:hypothetical protein